MSAGASDMLSGLREIEASFDAAIIDLWGVLHNGIAAYPGAIDCLRELKKRARPVCLLSNAPRRAREVAAKLRALGIGETLYDHLVTSGEETWKALFRRDDPAHAALGRRCYPISAADDMRFYEGLPLDLVATPEVADFVLVTGAESDDARLEDFVPILARCAAAGLPLVCANPDLVVTVGDQLCLCAGLLAQHYEFLGGTVLYHGKPFAPVYLECLRLLGQPEPARVIGIGDSLRTDVAGAHGIGARAVFITGGIHREELTVPWGEAPPSPVLEDFLAENGKRPDWVLPRLMW